ncbi:MAG: hypothetical protein BRC31_01480 [Actinobacteria bacterium QS_5_72_10]|nr:MAG: hypothetical protein BRC31_01480 [Actinobacteria bacterium QS_5_72_10]
MELPIFPLRVVLFPGRPLPVHIFEDRYRQMLTEVLEADRRFGIVAIRAGAAEDPAPSAFEVGCVSEVEQVTWLPHGRADVVARGVQRFRVQRWLEPAPYHRAEISPLADGDEIADPAKLAALRELLVPYLQALGAPDELACQLPDSAQVGLEEQQSLLEQDSTTARIDDTVTLLRRETGLIRHFGSVGSLRPPGPNGAELN